jgi:hypothetical protein
MVILLLVSNFPSLETGSSFSVLTLHTHYTIYYLNPLDNCIATAIRSLFSGFIITFPLSPIKPLNVVTSMVLVGGFHRHSHQSRETQGTSSDNLNALQL